MSIPTFRPCFDEEEVEAVREVLLSGWVGPGPKVEAFEKKFAEYVGTRFALSMNSCSATLFASMKVIGVEDKEVVTTAQTFVSTNHAILQNGGIPVFADIEPDTLNIDPDSVADRVTDKTGAIVVVHHGGHPCDMDRINEIADARGIPVVEDAAHAAGTLYKGRRAGSLGTTGCFSFHALKNVSTGDGGMLTTDDEAIAERVKNLRWMGITRSTYDRFRKNGRQRAWEYDVDEVGYKFHMNDLNAAIGIVQLGKLESTNAARREVAVQYRAAFKDLPWVEVLDEKEYARSSHQSFVMLAEDRDRLIEHLAEKGIDAGVHYRPNHMYSVYEPYKRSLPVTEAVWTRMVTLPMFPAMTNDDVNQVIDAVRGFQPSASS
ncbi:TPA: DegT/DnrJ/EryC1/StrS aminotransferase family protein [Candidatus Latescibacteria bacterium]|nr:pyridoxal-5'-phosphate-dependent protein [Gemmatimonadota bacterium]HAA74215.1 DegT/DnrJ/EryC1/StrS aminotransferase family protein [Candidatus Latescibacterota bacterium]